MGREGFEGGALAAPVPLELTPRQLDELLDFNVVVINLARNRDRLAHFRAMFYRTDLASRSFTRFDAIDGRRVQLRDVVTPKALQEIETAERHLYRERHYQLTRGAVGCFLSHVAVWKSLLASDKSVIMVCEDDCQLDRDILARYTELVVTLPPDWDVLLAGYFCNSCITRGASREVLRWFGMHTYWVTRRGAERMLALPILPIAEQVDAFLSDAAEAGRIKVFASTEKHSSQAAFETNIQVPVRVPVGVDPWTRLADDL